MEIDKHYKYKKYVSLDKYDFKSKHEFFDFVRFLQDDFSNSVSCCKLVNDRITVRMDSLKGLSQEISDSDSIIKLEITIEGKNSGIQVNYSNLFFIKNNFTMVTYSNDKKDLMKLVDSILNELKKYKNELRKVWFKVVTSTFMLIFFISLFSSFIDYNRFTSGNIDIDTMLLFDMLFVTLSPMFLGLILYNSSVPTVRIIQNNGSFTGIKRYFKQEYKSIIKDVFIASVFLLIGILIKG